MRLRFLGANRQVTGSRHYLDAGQAKVLIDCGMFQEREFLDRNWESSPVSPADLDAVVLTHAHVDHCGLLPRLVRDGFRGPIFATGASRALMELVLRDSAEIQAEDAAFKRKRHRKEGRRGQHEEVPLFTYKDVDRTMPHVEAIPYGQPVRVNEQVYLTFHDAGHILGSAIVEIAVRNAGRSSRLLFSGDLGQWGKPLLCDPAEFDRADYVVMESTYGDRDHPAPRGRGRAARNRDRGNDRPGREPRGAHLRRRAAQEMVYYFHQLTAANRIPKLPVYLDSPMAVAATAIFEKHRECYDDQTWKMLDAGDQPLRFPGLKLVKTVEQSKQINELCGPAIIMAPSGMCTAGRIKHHLAHNITRPECTILFTGYQGRGTLGRQILQGDREVRIHGRTWPVRARICEIHGLSGHADRTGLLRWLGAIHQPPRRLFLTHGEEESSLHLAEQIRQERQWQVTVPSYQEEAALDC